MNFKVFASMVYFDHLSVNIKKKKIFFATSKEGLADADKKQAIAGLGHFRSWCANQA
uniref:Uncharacterized protein n=1 Tax=Anguilla anguilla TaxID=7936 RepID=A0A0E9SF43_ANGAN